MKDRRAGRFCKVYAGIMKKMQRATEEFAKDVRQAEFPTPANEYPMDERELEEFLQLVKTTKTRKT